jgi:hypothetical protein
MPEIGTSGSMSGDGKRNVGHRPQVTAPILDSTIASLAAMQDLMPQTKGLEVARVEGQVVPIDPNSKQVLTVIVPEP